jgi:hypothetical protein
MNTKRICLLLTLLLTCILTACSAPNSVSVDPAATTQGFWAAINARKIDTAMAFVTDDVQLSGGPFSSFAHKTELSAIMSSQTKDGATYEISDLKVGPSDTVTFNLKVISGGMTDANGPGKFQVNKDGKFILMNFPN